MILKQQNKKRTLIAMLAVILLSITAFMGVTLSANAADANTCDLVINFNSSLCSIQYATVDELPNKDTLAPEYDYVYQAIPKEAWNDMTSGKTYSIDRGDALVIKIVPMYGYTLSGEFKGEKGGLYSGGVQQTVETLPNANAIFYDSEFNDTQTFDVTCIHRTFQLQLEPEAGEAAILYKLINAEGEEIDAPNPYLSFVYGQRYDENNLLSDNGETKLTLPKAVREGYIFKGWEVVKESGTSDTPIGSDNKLSTSLQLTTDMVNTEKILVRPIFEREKFDVTVIDYVVQDSTSQNISYVIDESLGGKANGYTWKVEMGVRIDPLVDGPTVNYLGYILCGGDPGRRVNRPATPGDATNTFRRYFLPITYQISYDFNRGTAPANPVREHTFDRTTALPTPTRTGYNFTGWLVTVDGKEVGTVKTLDAKTAAYAVQDADQTIYLTAQWEPQKYEIVYDLGGGAFTDAYSTEHIYDQSTLVPDPTRAGYIFKGWYINGAEDPKTLHDSKLPGTQLPGADGTITMRARWVAKSFTVLLDGNVGDTGDTVKNLDTSFEEEITYDAILEGVLTDIPTRVGYTFKGFYTAKEGGVCYVDAKGYGTGEKWQLDGENGGEITLYAQWSPNPYDIKLEFDHDLVVSVIVDGKEYTNGDVVTVYYRTPVSIKIVTKDGYKVVELDGKELARHTAVFDGTYTHERVTDEVYTVSFEILPTINAPAFKIDYATETVVPLYGGNYPAGSYSFFIGEGEGTFWFEAEVDSNGRIRINGDLVGAIKLTEECFGSSIGIIARGRRGFEADSDLIIIAVPARPAAPDVQYSFTAKQDQITLDIATEGMFQFSISTDPNAPSAVWLDQPDFTKLADGSALTPGTAYYVFVRVKYTDVTPASLPKLPPMSFRTEPVTDEISLIPPIAVLGATLLCQITAIAFLLIRRRKTKKNAEQLYGIAPISVLAVRFLPAQGLPVVLLLAALVIIAQIILTYLIVTSDLIRRPKKEKTPKDEPMETLPEEARAEETEEDIIASGEAAMRIFDEPDEDAEREPVLTTLTDADIADPSLEDAYHITYEMEDEEDADGEFVDQDVAGAYEQIVLEGEGAEAETFDQADFIEPAPAPQYSLEDEEMAWMPEEEAAEQIDVDAAVFEYDEVAEDAETAEEAVEETVTENAEDAEDAEAVTVTEEDGEPEDIDDSYLAEHEEIVTELDDIDDSKEF